VSEYSEAFRRRMVQRMTPPRATSATTLSAEVGVPQPTLSRWLRDAATVGDVAKRKKTETRAPQREAIAARPLSSWAPEEKVAIVLEAGGVTEAELGGWLRARGLHEEDLTRFRDEVRAAAVAGLAPKRTKGTAAEQKRIKELERELRRSKAALAETAALLVLRKKAVALWGEEGDDT
jgi:transposase-like protein